MGKSRRRAAPDRKYLVLKVRLSPTQLEQIARGARLSNPDDPPHVSTWIRRLALEKAARLEKADAT